MEYAGVVTVVGVIAAAVIVTSSGGVGATIRDAMSGAVCAALDSGNCDSVETADEGAPEDTPADDGAPTFVHAFDPEGPGAGITPVNNDVDQDCEPGGLGTDHDRRDTGRDAERESEDDRNRRDGADQEVGTCGPESNGSNGLGDPVPGETVDIPDPPAWEPVDEGAGEWGSEESIASGIKTRFTRRTAEAAANAMAGAWPDASRNLLHFLANSGDPLEQDVDQMLEDVPEFRGAVDQNIDNFVATAINQAQTDGADGPLTFPVNTAWRGHYIGSPDNWFYAVGGIQYNITGQVTVYPPSEPDGEWRYESSTRVNMRDQYNWDGGKGVTIGPFDVSDETLAEMHRAGVAREFLAYGQSEEETREGTS